MKLHDDMYRVYKAWREAQGDEYVELRSDKKILSYIIQLIGKAIEKKKGTKADSGDILEGWKALLFSWGRLDKFYQKRRELKNILSDFNVILNAIKHEKNKGRFAQGGATARAIARFNREATNQ